jgi:hypothetical protein
MAAAGRATGGGSRDVHVDGVQAWRATREIRGAGAKARGEAYGAGGMPGPYAEFVRYACGRYDYIGERYLTRLTGKVRTRSIAGEYVVSCGQRTARQPT